MNIQEAINKGKTDYPVKQNVYDQLDQIQYQITHQLEENTLHTAKTLLGLYQKQRDYVLSVSTKDNYYSDILPSENRKVQLLKDFIQELEIIRR